MQAGLCKRAAGRHTIFYLYDANTPDIVRVLHDSMDFSVHLANEET